MRTSTEQLGRVLRGGSFRAVLTVDVFYGPDRVLQDVPVDDWLFTGDLGAEVCYGGELSIVYQGDLAESYTPREVTDALAPFGQRVIPYLTVSAGPFTERVQLGVFRIADVPEAEDQFLTRGGRRLVVGSVVRVTLLDLFEQVRRAKFRSLEQPASLTSAWGEIARVTGLPVTQSVADAAIPQTITYDRSRLTATQVLASVLDARAVMLSDGSVGAVPNTPGAAVADLLIGDEGVVLSAGYSLSSKDIPNVVVGDFEDSTGNQIHVEAALPDGHPLAPTGPYGENVAEYASDKKQLIKTRAAAQAAVNAELTRLSSVSALVPVEALLDPRLELGDVVTIQQPDRTLTARIRKWSIGHLSPMSLTVEVLSDEPA